MRYVKLFFVLLALIAINCRTSAPANLPVDAGDFSIDPQRIYVTRASNGDTMTCRQQFQR